MFVRRSIEKLQGNAIYVMKWRVRAEAAGADAPALLSITLFARPEG